MSILSTERVSHTYNDRWLFKDLNFGVSKGDRVALVGVNGTGKSTLLKILAENLEPTEGIVVKEKGIKVGILSQDPDFEGFDTINDFIYDKDNKQQNLVWQYEKLLSDDSPDKHKLEELTDEITALDAWDYELNMKTILSRLNIENFDQEIKTLSGGQRKRLSLAKLLIDDPEVYILDEPTNHLDIETIEWLEKILTSGQKTVILVSHDRYFLDNVCTEIRELDNGLMFSYKGNYAYFLEKKSERETLTQIVVEKSRNLLTKELEWMRRQPKARGTKSKSRIEAFYDLEKKAAGIQQKQNIQLDVKVSRQGNKIIEIDNASVSFGAKSIIKDFNYTFKKGDRIGLAGKNGSGKSTFLNLITGELNPNQGKLNIGETTVFGYYKQQGLEFKEGDRVIDVVKEVAEYISTPKGETITASQLLTRFLFTPQKQHGRVEKLSGGEKKRLQLMRVLMKNPNVLILDEPTNDLDIDTLNVLEDFLDNYPGVLILVSHDRYLIDKLTSQLFIFDGKGNISIYNGNYADFKEEEAIKTKAEKEKQKKDNKDHIKLNSTKPNKKPTFKEQLEFEELNKSISLIEKQITDITEQMNSSVNHEEIIKLAEQIETLNGSLEEQSDRWLELSEKI